MVSHSNSPLKALLVHWFVSLRSIRHADSSMSDRVRSNSTAPQSHSRHCAHGTVVDSRWFYEGRLRRWGLVCSHARNGAGAHGSSVDGASEKCRSNLSSAKADCAKGASVFKFNSIRRDSPRMPTMPTSRDSRPCRALKQDCTLPCPIPVGTVEQCFDSTRDTAQDKTSSLSL